MKNNHFLHGVVTVSLFALNIVIITVFLLNNTWNSYLRGEMSLQVALLVSPVLFITLMVLTIEWKGIVNSLKVEEESLASVEKKHPYLPKAPQRILTGILSMIAMVIIVPVITRAAASSGEILHMLSSGTGSIFETQETSSDSSVSSSLDEIDSSSSESQDHGAADEIVNAETGAVLTGSGALETGSGSLSSSAGSGAEVISSSAQSEASGEVHAPVSSVSSSSSVSSVSDVVLSSAVLTLESRDGKLAYEASDSPSFTLVETSIAHNDPSVGADGTLKDQKALEEIVRSVVNAQDIQDAMSKAIIDHARGEIAKQVTEDTVSVNTLKQISESSDTGAPRLDAMQSQVQANIDVNDSIKTEVSQTVSRDEAVQTALDVLSTEEVKQSIVENIVSDILDTLASGDSTVVSVDDATVFQAAVEVNAAAVDAAEKSVLTSVESNSDIKQYIAQAVVSSAEMSEDSSLVWTDTQEAAQVDSNPIITVRLTDKNGKVLYPNYHFKRGSVVLVLEPEQSFTPGVYLLEVEITNPLTGEVTTQTEEFAWGVLAMNPDKDTYSPSETAHIAIGVLDDDGEMVCDADVTLTVQKPDGSTMQMQTSDGSIRMNSSACSTKNSMQVTPDFETDLLLSQAGTYSLTLEAQTPNGTHSITSSILVSGNLAYSIRRTAATRLYPFGWSPMTIIVRFNEQFSGTLTDILPEEFTVRSDDSSAVITKQEGTGSLISWTGLWAAGETATFAYQYDAPDISPQFYLVGPLSLRGNATEAQESRSWQIANDAINVSITGTAYSNEGITPLASKTVAVSLNGAAAAGTAVTDAGGQYTITGLTLTGGTIVTVYMENETEDAVTVSTGSGGAMTGMTLYQNQLIVKSGTGGNATVSTALMAVADNNADADISALYSISSNNTTVAAGKKLSIWTGATLSLAGTLSASRVHLQGSLRPNNFALTFSNHYTQSGGTLFGSSGTRTIGNITIDSGTFISTSGTMTVSGSYVRAGGTFTHNAGTVSFTTPRTASIDVPTTETFSGFHVNTGVSAINIQIGTGDTLTAIGTTQLQNGKLKTGTLNVQAAFTNNSTWDGGAYFLNFSGSANQAWAVGGSASDAFVTINKSSGKLTIPAGNGFATNTGITLLSGSFSMQNASFTMGGGLTVAAGTTMVSTGSIAFTPTSGNTATINFAGSGYILNASLAGATSGRIAIQTGSTLPIRGRLTLSNNAIINGGGIIDVKGNILESGTGLTGNAPVRLSGTGTQFIIRQGSSVFHGGSLIIAKPSGQVTLSGALTLNTTNQNLLLTGGTLNLNGYNLTVNNIFTVGTGTTLKLKGTETITGGPDFIHRGATTYYTEPSQTLRLKNFTPNYQNIVLGSTGSAIFRPSKQGMTMSGTLTISGGTLQFDGGQSLTISGSYLRTGGAFSSGTGTINILTQGQTKTFNETSPVYNLNIDDGLIGYWKFDEGVGTVAKDSSRSRNNGTLTNGPVWSGSSLYSSNFYNPTSLRFDGNNDYVNIGDIDEIDTAQQLTLCAWVKHLSDTVDQGIIHKRATSNPGILLFRDDVGLTAKTDIYTFYIEGPGFVSTRVDTATNSATAGVWRHVCAVYRANNAIGLQLFINGAQAATPVSTVGFSTNIDAGSQSLQIGTRDSNLPHHGSIDDVRIYNRALSASEINALATGNPATGSGKLLLASNLDINGNLGIYGSTLDVSASNYAVNIAGNVQNSGDFTKRSGTVTLDGTSAQTVSGSTLWNNISKTVSAAQSLFLDYTSRQSASGALTLRGASSNLLSLRSTRAGSGARLLLDSDAGTQTIDYLNVKDSDASGGATLVCMATSEGCVDAGNNSNWSFIAPATGTGSILGLVFNDLNGNGVKSASETTGLASIPVLLTGATSTGASVSRSTTTNSLGQYFFSGSIISNTSGYTITVNSGTAPTGYLRTSFNSSGSNVLGTGAIIRINFGYVQPSTGTGKVYIDTNDNGRLDTGETTGISGVTTTILGTTATGGTINRSTTTSSTGGYLFSGLAPSLGQYTFGVTTNTIPSGYRATNFTNSGVTIPQGNSAVTANFGYFWYGTMTGSIFIDSNANGVKDSGENSTYNSGATISVSGLTASGGSLSITRQTTSTGSFTLQDVPTSNTTYAVTLSVPSGYQVTTASSFNRSIAVGQNASMSLFGLKRLSSTGTIKGVVFNDENGNGQKNETESVGLSTVTVTLNGQTETGATLSRSTSTNSLGQYFFSGALLSNASGYTVAVTANTLPAGYLRTRFNSSGSNILTANSLINVHFGYVQASTLSGTVYVDANENAVQDVGETTIFSGATLSLTGLSGTGGTVDQSTVSSSTGSYIFSNLPTSSGSFILVITPPTGYTTTSSNSRIVTFGTGGQLKIQRFGYILTPVTSSSSSSTSSSSEGGVSSSTVTLPTGGSRIRYTPIVIQPEIDETGGGGSSSVSSSSSSVRSSSSSSVSSSSASSVPWNRLPISRQPILPAASVAQDTTEFIFNQQTETVADTLDNRWNDIQKQAEDTVQTVRQSVSAGVQTTQQTVQSAIGMTASTLRTAATSIAAGANAIGTRIASFGVRAQNNVASAGNRLGFSLADVTTHAAVATANSLAISYKTVALAVYSTRTTGSLMFSGLNVALVDNNKNIRAAAEVIAANIREGDMQIRQVAMAISAVGNTALQGVADTVGTGGKALQDTAVSIASTLRMSTQFVAGSLNAAVDTIAMTVGTSVDRIGMSLDTAVTSTNRVVAVAYVSTSRFALETVSGIGSLSDQAKTLLIKKDLATEALDRPLPPKKYQTTIAMKNDKVVIGELSFNILKSFGVPYRQTPVILFSTPKIAITDDAGDVTFHDVEVGTHHIEIHIDDKTVETREVVVEPPAKINLTEDSAVHVKLPLIEIQVETPAQTAMHSAAPAGMPWYWLVVIPLLMTNAVMGFLLIVHRQRRKEEVAAKI